MFGKIKNFFIESRLELRQVQWPTRTETAYLTGIVLAISLLLAAFLGGVDYLLSYGLRLLITHF